MIRTFVILVALIAGLGLAAPPAAQPWVIENVHRSIVSVGEYNSLELTTTSRPHVAYDMWTATGQRLWYAWKNDGETVWRRELVDSQSPQGVGSWSSLALDANGNAHVSYFDNDAEDLRYALKSGGIWTRETVDGESSAVGYGSSIEVDFGGNPHIGYMGVTDMGEGMVKYACKMAGVWTTEFAAGPANLVSTIALDASGNPHLCFEDRPKRDLVHAVKSGGVWTIETVDATENYVGASASLAFDAWGTLHVGYVDRSTWDIKYARKSGGAWTVEGVDVSADSMARTSLALDASGNVHISYCDVWGGELWYAVKAVGSWSLQVIPGEPNDIRQDSSIEIDALGKPHISYFEFESDDLKYVYVPPAVGVSSDLQLFSSSIGSGRAMAVFPNPALNGILRVVYQVGARSHAADLAVFDSAGRRVRTLAYGNRPPGLATAAWDGCDDGARRVGPGVYFVRLSVGGAALDTKRVTLIR